MTHREAVYGSPCPEDDPLLNPYLDARTAMHVGSCKLAVVKYAPDPIFRFGRDVEN